MANPASQVFVQSIQKQADAIELAVERMLVTPGPLGVLVESWPDGSWRVSLSAEVAPMEVTYQGRQVRDA